MLNNKSLVFLSLAALVAVSSAHSLFDSELDLETRIVNGKPAARGQFPFYALLKIILTDGRAAWCGGTLINSQWVYTAGHCVRINGLTIDRFEVHLGALNVTDLNEEGRVIVVTKQAFRHPQYSLLQIQNDVALLKLEQPVNFTNFVQAVNLTSNASLTEGTKVVAIGFGKQQTSDTTISPTLQFAELVHITRAECARTFPFLSRREDVICARGLNKESPCNGDSGGPLIALENGVPTLVGGTSFGHFLGCHLGYPGGFSNTSKFGPWVQQTIASN